MGGRKGEWEGGRRAGEGEGVRGVKKVGIIDANKIAMEEIGLPIPNTVIAGAFARISGLLAVESCCEALQDYFSGKKLAANIVCTKRGFEEVKIYEM